MLAGLAACAWQGPAQDIVTQRLTWFDFAGADDIRSACAAGSRDRYRLIHVADFDRQVRNYDLEVTADGSGTLLQIIDRGVTIDPATETLGDILGPTVATRGHRGRRGRGARPDARRRRPCRRGTRLVAPRSAAGWSRRQHFWLVAACRDGRFSLTGIADPDGDFDPPGVDLGVDEAMRALDGTGIAWPTATPPIDAHSLAACTVEKTPGRPLDLFSPPDRRERTGGPDRPVAVQVRSATGGR